MSARLGPWNGQPAGGNLLELPAIGLAGAPRAGPHIGSNLVRAGSAGDDRTHLDAAEQAADRHRQQVKLPVRCELREPLYGVKLPVSRRSNGAAAGRRLLLSA